MGWSRLMKGWAAVVIAAVMIATFDAAIGDAAGAQELTDVVVTASDTADAAALVERYGGVVGVELHLIGGVAAQVPARVVAALGRAPGVTVTPDAPMRFQSMDSAAAPTGELQLAALNPPEHWTHDAGAGVGVALLDTGVVEVGDLAGRVIHGPDYSDEGDGVDRYGHGTFMAGLIAGDPGSDHPDLAPYSAAPGAHIVSVKLAGRDGVTSLSRVLDAIGWVVTNQDEHGIRVMNLSVGVPTNRAPQADPLSAAVQAAWASGITVVAASGNEGADGVTSPGRDAWIITVGATDTNGTAATSDDTVPEWSGVGRVTGRHKPDLLAPGVSVISARAPGSHVDTSNPQARVGDDHFRGSGTSMSAALVSGAAAALVELRPWATPDDVKGALLGSGQPIDGSTAVAVDLAAADAAPPDPSWHQDHHIAFNRLGQRLHGGMPWTQDGAPGTEETWQRMRWVDGQWHRMRWVDGEWQRMRWVGDSEWQRMRWVDEGWQRMRWVDEGWQRMRWVDANLARMRWVDANLTRMRWVSSDWADVAWSGSTWTHDDTWTRLRWVSSLWEDRSAP